MKRIVVFGLGYSAKRIAAGLAADGWEVISTGRDGTLGFGDSAQVRVALADAEAVLSSVPPDGTGTDPVLDAYGDALGAKTLVYLSSTGVYGDAGGAWVDESAPIAGRRGGRNDADASWLARGARVLRLPGIYGPGRSMLERVREGRAHRIDLPGHVFSRIHVGDLADGAVRALAAPPGAYNLADDAPASQNAVVEEACRLLGLPLPPLQALAEAALSPAALAFYAENRRIANGKARRVLGWSPRYPSFREGLAALLAGERAGDSASASPAIATTAPEPASSDQR
ncbi:SDR family NAD(P)-dependent oxidoreductase [Parablastomonas sp. CN1-191]|uniref:SDR family NAD(P)-dependent oxidoreductase n=1 Tax=Parablastomonas sp. CN1-191 TaxID=3400908 RepID=UPI003BF81A14